MHSTLSEFLREAPIDKPDAETMAGHAEIDVADPPVFDKFLCLRAAETMGENE